MTYLGKYLTRLQLKITKVLGKIRERDGVVYHVCQLDDTLLLRTDCL